MSEILILGVDGGGTKTSAWLAKGCAGAARITASRHRDGEMDDEETLCVLGRGVAGPSNLRSVGLRNATSALGAAIAAAFANAGIAQRTVDQAVFGLAGVGRPVDREAVEQWAESASVAARLAVLPDAESIVRGGRRSWGVALVAGTGSMAFGVACGGAAARSGGWGQYFGDEGSAYWVAIEGLRIACKSTDGRSPPTSLLKGFVDRLGVASAAGFVESLCGQAVDKSAIAELAITVFDAAHRGDEAARGIVERAAEELSSCVIGVLTQLEIQRETDFPLNLVGGMALSQPLLAERICELLNLRGWRPNPIDLVSEPAMHALRSALRLSRA